MTVIPVNVGDVMDALAAQIERHAAVQDEGIETVERCEPAPDTEDRCPWVGLFRVRVSFPPRTLGAGAGFRRQLIRIAVGIAQSDPNSGAECEERLERLVAAVIGAILTDPSIGGTVSTLAEDFELVYPAYQKLEDQPYVQLAYLEFTAIAQVSIS